MLMSFKIKIKVIVAFALVLSICMPLFACSKDKGPRATIPPDSSLKIEGTVKFTRDVSKLSEERASDAFVEAFEEMYPDVTVIKDYNPGNVPARIASGEIGDVFSFIESDTYNYAVTQKALLPLNQYIQPLNIDMSEVFSGILELGKVEGQLYMVPQDYNHLVILYNKTALKQAGLEDPARGWTWEEYKDYAEKLTMTDPNDANLYTQVGGYLNYGFAPVYVSILAGWGGTWVDTENKKVDLTSDKVRAGIEDVLNLAKSGVIFPEGKSDTSSYTGVGNHNFVLRTIVYPQLPSYANSFDSLGIEWDLADFPKFPGRHAVGTGSTGYGVYNYTENPNAAAALCLFFLSKEGQLAFHSTDGGNVPLVRELADSDFWRGHGSDNPEEFDWSTKNYDAFISFPDADVVGRPNCMMPTQIASYITSGWGGVLGSFFDNGNYIDILTEIETRCNQTWERILSNQK